MEGIEETHEDKIEETKEEKKDKGQNKRRKNIFWRVLNLEIWIRKT